MGLLSLIHLLLKRPRPAQDQNTDDAVHELTPGKFSEGLFDAALPQYELQPVRLEISKNHRR
jgi:hypothetical protein